MPRCRRSGGRGCMIRRRRRSKGSFMTGWRSTPASWPITIAAVATPRRPRSTFIWGAIGQLGLCLCGGHQPPYYGPGVAQYAPRHSRARRARADAQPRPRYAAHGHQGPCVPPRGPSLAPGMGSVSADGPDASASARAARILAVLSGEGKVTDGTGTLVSRSPFTLQPDSISFAARSRRCKNAPRQRARAYGAGRRLRCPRHRRRDLGRDRITRRPDAVPQEGAVAVTPRRL